MCGRFTLRTPTESIVDLFSGIDIPPLPPNYNVAPTQSVATIRNYHDQREFAWLHWGLIPFWATDRKIGSRMINARSETVREKPAFRAAFQKRRCLVLADGFYEWKATPDGKQPMYVTMRDDGPFCMAGLWESNRKLDEPVQSCTIITTDANPLMAPIHDRMPVILPRDAWESWLDPGFEDADWLEKQLQPCDSDQMSVRPVSRNVNKVAYNQPDCIEPVAIQAELDF
ncbi:MAG: SOS response-associated peptidase [Pirellulaceae bacterium]